jgi:hypothetical protein
MPEIAFYPTSRGGEVWIQGEQIPEEIVEAVQFTWERGTVPKTVVVLREPLTTAAAEGIEQIHIVQPSAVDGERILTALNNLNAEVVEERALAGMGWGDGNMTEAIIRTIQEMLRGDQPDGSPSGSGAAAPG